MYSFHAQASFIVMLSPLLSLQVNPDELALSVATTLYDFLSWTNAHQRIDSLKEVCTHPIPLA
jgi:hypothetical protein